ncbi:NAD(P)/FAD-dependent oxidoreductase [Streptomyces sp. ASQP_92]|uniref:NAD(P)/FAD-dependent oxidoreductase n=1 Tax=Streptomyces sp. ASQP_92 TaxID=2979116 RepID=UPI0021C00226|nr:NAD(P)/FAD-dependent oxidoreductase [Streptomyces sp. ASQP_92]MCT9091617.1 NAD(P)/FAD-dependent oxidoreductase [Streptomyces sp. ASQP_92]
MRDEAGYDVVISGASIAGCAAAVLLARQGARVALLERRRDPGSYKVLCTHYLQPSARPVLEELGLTAALEAAGAVRAYGRWYTRWGWAEPRTGQRGESVPYAYNIRRSVLDRLLRDHAAATPGVDVLLGHTVIGLLSEGGRTVGVRARTAHGEREMRALLVVGADGNNSEVARCAGVPTRVHANARFSYFAHFRNLPTPDGLSQTWFLEPDVAYALPTDDGVTVMGVSPDSKKLPAFRADLENSFMAFLRELPGDLPIDAAERVTKITGTTHYPLYSRRPTGRGLALIGDAATTSDPVWGVGCGWALQSAQWLAQTVGPAVTGDADLERALRAYRRRHRRGLWAHQFMIADYAKRRRFNLFERLMFAAAARDADVARHLHRFAARLIGPVQLMSPGAVAKALLVVLRHRGRPLAVSRQVVHEAP